MQFSHNRIVGYLLIVAFVYSWMATKANAQFFCVDQLVNSSHAETWNTYLGPKGYISYYCENIWRPQHQGENIQGVFEIPIPLPESLFARGFFIKKDEYVAVFENSRLKAIDRISGFWGRFTGGNEHIYIGLATNGLEDAWDMNYTRLYVIDSTVASLEEFHSVDLTVGTSLEYDSILSCAVVYLIQHRRLIHDIWDDVDSVISFDDLKQYIQNTFAITIFVGDFTGDDMDDFILKTAQKGSKWLANTFTFVFESEGISPQFIHWSKFEQVVQGDHVYFLMLMDWLPHTGCWGWSIYEGTGSGTLKHVFGEADYSM